MNAISFVVILTLTLLVVSTMTILPSALADTSTIKIFGKYNAIYHANATKIPYFNGEPYFEGITYFENKTGNFLKDSDNKTGLMTNEDNQTDIPVGQYGKEDYELFILVDRTQIPKTDWLDTVTINSIQLNALVDSVENYTENKTFVSVSYCHMGTWHKKLEEALKKNYTYVFEANKVTIDYVKMCLILDSVVVEKNDLPKAYSWDLSNAIDDLIKATPSLPLILSHGR